MNEWIQLEILSVTEPETLLLLSCLSKDAVGHYRAGLKMTFPRVHICDPFGYSLTVIWPRFHFWGGGGGGSRRGGGTRERRQERGCKRKIAPCLTGTLIIKRLLAIVKSNCSEGQIS